MKTGELRRFKYDINPDESEDAPLAGQTFVVIALHQPGAGLGTVDFLIGSRLETGWNQRWVGRHSEVLDVIE
jgi:hypothetical protein